MYRLQNSALFSVSRQHIHLDQCSWSFCSEHWYNAPSGAPQVDVPHWAALQHDGDGWVGAGLSLSLYSCGLIVEAAVQGVRRHQL